MGEAAAKVAADIRGVNPWTDVHWPEKAKAAADLIVSQEAEIEKLREALKPFATCIDRLAPGDDIAHWRLTGALNHGLMVAHVLAARLALSENSDDKG
jgi:hypothetical protein